MRTIKATALPLPLITLALAPLVGAGQGTAPEKCSAITPSERRAITISLAVTDIDLRPIAPKGDDLRILRSIQRHFDPPSEPTLPLWAMTISLERPVVRGPPWIGFGLDDFFAIVFNTAGDLETTALQVSTSIPELNARLVAAVLNADSSGELRIADRSPARKRVRLVDSSLVDGAVPLFRAELGVIPIENPPVLVKDARAAYPRNAAYRGLGDTITLQYVVEASGRVRDASARVLRGRYLEFMETTIASLNAKRFTPAMIRGCVVPSLVEQTFVFGGRR